MFPRLSVYFLLAIVSLCGMVATTPVPVEERAIEKRALCAELWPGSITLTGESSTPFIACDGLPSPVSFWFQSDANFVV
jgi:hypothetical protein